jgi:hypothetical protein
MEKDYKEIGTITILDVFNKELAEVVLKFAKEHKPFDEPCARLDFRDKLEAAEKEQERIYGFVNPNLKIDYGDLSRYGDESLFTLLEDQEDYVDKVIEGSRTQVIIGHTLSYKCKKRGHGISVFIPIREYNEMNEKKKK